MKEPLVSVIMPVRNEEAHLPRALAAVLAQDWPNLEVIVADGMSEDGTRRAVEEAAQRAPGRVLLVDNPWKTAPAALNRALAAARGEYVVRVDGHCEIAPDYVSRCVAHLDSGRAECVGGPLATVGETRRAALIARAMSSRFGVGDSTFRTGTREPVLADTVAFPAFRAETLRALGPFDEELVRDQDDEFSYRLRARGGRVLVAPDVKARYFSRASVRSLFSQYAQYGYWKVRVLQKHPRQMRARQFVPAALVATLLLPVPLALLVPALLGIPLVALAAWVGGSLGAARACADGWHDVPTLFGAFAALHFGYGSGFSAGLVRFFPRFFERGAAPLAPLETA